MIHITKHTGGRSTLHLRLEGQLDDVHAGALRDVLAEARATGMTHFVLDCAGMTGAEGDGLEVLRTLKENGAQFIGLPVTIAWRLGLLHTMPSGSIQPS